MKGITIIGNNYDYFLCEKLTKNGFLIDFYSVDNLSKFTSASALLFLDLRGDELLTWTKPILRQLDKTTLVIVLIERAQLKSLLIHQLIAEYAWDYHTDPIEIERLLRLIGHAFGVLRIRKQNSIYDAPVVTSRSSIIMNSRVMQSLIRHIKRAAPTNIPILIRGESGTGKELIAKQIHQQSLQASGPFVAVNCGALASGVVQSELFGHEKGAFTGAVSAHKGKIAQADGGTLFLDEIGDLPLNQQVSLLRFLQEGTFDTVGGKQAQTADVRVIAATHIDIESAIERGEFRLDLYYRLNGITIELPPLRDREEDIIHLAYYFCDKYAKEYGIDKCTFSESAKEAMMQHSWEGNVRELINRIRRAVLLCDDHVIKVQDIDLQCESSVLDTNKCLKTIKDEVEKNALISAIKRHDGKMEVVADSLKISRATLYRLIDKHEIYTL